MVAVLLVGCSGNDQISQVELPQTPVLSARESWGVVDASYVRVYESANRDSDIVGHLRSGIVAEITGRVVSPVDSGRQGWVQVRQGELVGWVQRREIDLFETRERADNAARIIRGE
jgi:hypothetical protein